MIEKSLYKIYEEAICYIVDSPNNYVSYLKSACNNYKCDFRELAMIYVAKPDATAVLTMEQWNSKFARVVKSTAKEIPVIDFSQDELRSKSYIDISDTDSTEYSKPVPIWKLSELTHTNVADTINKTFDLNTRDLKSAIIASVDVIIKDSFATYISDFLKVKNREQAFSAISDMDAIRIYRDMIRSSTVFMVLSRCDLDTSDINMSSFENIKYFQSMDAFVELGNASFDNTKILLKYIATQALKEMRKENSYGKTEIGVQAGRTLYGSSGVYSEGRSNIEQIQQTQKDISVGASSENVRQTSDVGQAEPTSGGNRHSSSRASRGNNDSDEAGTRSNGTAEETRPNEMGRDDEQHHEFSGRNSVGGDSLQLQRLKDTVQKQNIENALVEDFNLSSTFSVSQEDIDAVITKGSNFVDGKYRIYQYFEQDHSVKEQNQFLKKEYGIGGGTFFYPDGTNGGFDYNAKGISIEKHGSYTNPDIVLSWSDVSKRIKQLIELDRYLTPKEKVLYSKWTENLQTDKPTEIETAPSSNYVYQNGDKVNIGASEYIISFIDDTRVVLQDAEFPLFTKEYAFNDFDTKVQENPMNNHLKVVETTSNKLDTTEKVEANNKNFVERYRELEQEYPDKILLFQVGDFFEVMGSNAEKISEALNITLTSRINGDERISMCGFPNSRLKTYTDMLLDSGYDLAIATEDNAEIVNFDSDRKHEPINSYPVGRIDYYNSDGEISDSIEYVNPTSIRRDLINDNPFEEMGLVLYRDSEGNVIPHSFVDNLPNPLKNFEIADYKKDDYEQENMKMDSPVLEKSEEKKSQISDIYKNIPMSERNVFDLKNFTLDEVGKKARYKRNAEAIRILKECEFENRFATADEQQKLAQYVGWGGIPEAFDENNDAWADEFKELYTTLSPAEYAQARESTLTAFYTPPVVIKAMYKALEQMNYREGNILEPSCGIGNFIGMLPDTMKNSNFYGVELDVISAGIAQQLYQRSNISAEPYEKVNLPDSFFDVVIGNVPFGDFKVADKRYDKHNFLIHDYFFAKSLDKLRAGGVMALITSKGTMDKENSSVRKYIAQRAELLGAIRLPNNTFKGNAGTEVVSDILFLQKRDRLVEIDQEWLHLNVDENGIKMNNYFIEHPEMVLGEMKMVSGRFGMEVTCVPYSDTNLEEQLMKAIENITGEFSEYDIEDVAEDNFIPADPSVRNFSYTIVEDNIYFRENSRMKQVDLSATADKRIRGMIKIRDSVRTLIELQTDNSTDEAIKAEQVKLNALYDEYTKEYGLLNSRANSSAFSDDSSYSLLCSLENIDENGKLESKADMFFKRTIRPHIPVASVDNASDALALSISEKAKVDIQYMSEVSHKSEQEIVSDLKGVIFKIPSNDFVEYQTADEYLSGNVRQKLRIAEAFAKSNSEYNVNVNALKNVQPKDLKASEIDVRLGSTWLPIEVVEKFIYELLDTPYYLKYEIKVSFSAFSSEWNISGKSADKANIKANKTYGTSRINAYRIIEDTLNLKDVKIFDTVEEPDGKKKRILNKKETAIALSKQDQIKSAFTSWVFKDPERRNELCKIYNERFNSIRPREYDGSHITFGGMSPEISLREHQLNAVAHVLYGGNTLLAHVVGAGKTYEMVAAAMESKRLGLCTKSLFVVPNHLIEQWASEFLQLYPSANILSSTKKDFEPANRKKFCGRIATGDYDAVIIGQSQFEKIPMSIERQKMYLEKQMDEILEGIAELKHHDGDNFTIKQMEKTRKSLKLKLDKLNDQSRKDDVVTFEELGVDRLFIDESHYYKNLYLYTKMRNVGGIAQTEAQKSSDLFMKCRYLDEITDNRGIIFATGTPISNSMVEMYTVQRYLQYDKLVDLQLQHFDAWASTFGETVTALELAPEGTGYRQKTRFSKFFNLPELMSTFKEVADIKTADVLNLPVPKVEYHNISCKPTEQQVEIVSGLADRAEAVRDGQVEPYIDNMLKITNDGRKLALDQRLINELLPDDENSKVSVCADNIFSLWDKTQDDKLTQLVFCDLSTPTTDGFNVYDDLKNKLILKGVPSEEIEFIHNANTEVKKQALFSKVRKGSVRILIGSTAKMGAGTNVQDKLIAIHHLDCPWRPSDLQQREGRIVRQGNTNEKVHIYIYVTENTFDAYLYQLVENKQKFIGQIMTSKSPVRAAEDIDEVALSYSEIKALATGNPLIKEKMDLDIQVSKLKLLKSNFLSEKYDLEDKISKYYPIEILKTQRNIEGLKLDIKHLSENTKPNDDGFSPMIIGSRSYYEKADAGEALLKACDKSIGSEPTKIGFYRGFDMKLFVDGVSGEFKLILHNELGYYVSLGKDIHGNIQRLDNCLTKLPEKLQKNEALLDNLENQFKNAKSEVTKVFSKEDELVSKMQRLSELNRLLEVDKMSKSNNKEKFIKVSETEKDILIASGYNDYSLSDDGKEYVFKYPANKDSEIKNLLNGSDNKLTV